MTLRKTLTMATCVAALGMLPMMTPGAVPAVQAGTQAKDAKMKAMNTMAGRTFDYQVANYKIRAEFLAEDKLRWTYLDAPDGQKGKTAEEKLDRQDVHYGIILFAWTEKDGTNVVDVFDLQTMTLHANAVMPNGKRFFTKATLSEVK